MACLEAKAGAGCSMSAASLTLMRILYIKTGPRNSLSAPHQVGKVDPFQNCGGEGIFLATPVYCCFQASIGPLPPSAYTRVSKTQKNSIFHVECDFSQVIRPRPKSQSKELRVMTYRNKERVVHCTAACNHRPGLSLSL